MRFEPHRAMIVRMVDLERSGIEQWIWSVHMMLRVKKTLPTTIGEGDDERVMVQPGMTPAGRRQGDCAVAACRHHTGEKRR